MTNVAAAHVLVIGGSLRQLERARALADEGNKVVVVESGTFLGAELTRCQRPWITWKEKQRDFYKFWLPLGDGGAHHEGDVIPLHVDRLKLKLEDRLLEAGVTILYAARVVRIEEKSDHVVAWLGHKGGLKRIRVQEILEDTSEAVHTGPYLWTIDFTEVSNPADRYDMPEDIGVVGNRVLVNPGVLSSGHYFVEVPLDDSSPGAVGRVLLAAQHLLENVSAFQHSKLGVCSLEPYPCMERQVDISVDAKTIPWEGFNVPVVRMMDVLVVGGGTSGATAARVAAEKGASTVLVEANARLGGTGTIGGTNRYWFGRRCGFTEQIDAKVRELSNRLNIPPERLFWSDDDCWHQEVKAYVLLQMCEEAGVEILFDCTAIGVVSASDQVKAVIFAGNDGLFAIEADVVIDATGDADLAVHLGAPVIYGNERDRFTLWYSLAQYYAPGQSKNNFTSTVHVGDLEDYSRAILAGRRRGVDTYDHGAYLAPRESRHIVGDITLTLEDQLLHKEFPDTINICFSNHDPKGISMADSIMCGLLPPHLQIEIPYRALLPKGVRNLLVVGKAISATHDAFAAVRMQADLQNLGGAAGIAAALAVKAGVSLRDISIENLQKTLVAQRVLPAYVVGRIEQNAHRPTTCDSASIVTKLTGDEPWEWLEMDMTESLGSSPIIAKLLYCNSTEIVPQLLEAYEKSSGRLRLQYARLLAWHRNPKGLPDIITEIRRLFNCDPPLPKRTGSTRFATLPPDHGVMPEACYLLYTLARSPSRESIPEFTELTDRIVQADRDYGDIRKGMFHYVDSVAYAAERMGYPEFVDLLLRLSALPEFRDCVVTAGIQVDVLGERLAYLNLRIQCALARCGSRVGLVGLASYAEDNRALLRESAIDELRAITGVTVKRGLWNEYVHRLPEQYEPVLITK